MVISLKYQNKETMTNEIKFLGVTEEINQCDRCGKADLQRTYAIEIDGETFYLGSSCIAHRFEMTTSKVNTWIKNETQKLKRSLEVKAENHASAEFKAFEEKRDLPGNDYWTAGVKDLLRIAKQKKEKFLLDHNYYSL